MLKAAVIALHGKSRLALRVFRQLRIEVYHLSAGVVDYLHTVHLFCEWPAVAVIENGHLIILAAMISQAQDCRLGQFGRVVVHDCYLSCLLLHSSLKFKFHLMMVRAQAWGRYSPGWFGYLIKNSDCFATIVHLKLFAFAKDKISGFACNLFGT